MLLFASALHAQQPTIDRKTQLRNFAHTHLTTAEGGKLGIQALLDSIKSGGATGTKLATVNTSLTSGFCLEADADGNIRTASSGAACGTGTPAVDSVFGRIGAVIAATNDYAFTQIGGTNAVNKGGTGAVTLTGIPIADGTNPFTALAAGSMLQYLRRQANTTSVTYNFAPLADLIAGDYYWSQTPGGSIAIGANVVTLTPGPLGVKGSATGQYVYLSAGTGTAEAALVTGGSCDGTGQTSCTVNFTAAHTHSGAYTIASASGGIKECFEVAAANPGGVCRAPGTSSPYTLYQTLVLGNGSTSTPSTQNNIFLIGDGGGATDSEVNPATAGTMLYWAGPVGGTMMDIEGPFAGAHIKGLFFQCGGATRAATGLISNHAFNSEFRDFEFNGCSGFAIKNYAYGQPSNMATGANNNLWEQIQVYLGSGNGTGASGMQVGKGANTPGDVLDVAQNIYKKVSLNVGTTGVGLDLRLTDSSRFENLGIGCASGCTSIKITEVIGDTGGHFPQAITFVDSNACCGASTVDDSTWTGTVVGGWFWPWNNDNDTQEDPLGTNSWGAGVSNNGRWFGKFKTVPNIYTAQTSSAAIASTASETAFSKSFEIPAKTLKAGARVRVTASGKFSDTGTPTLQIALKLGGSGVSGSSFAVIPATTLGSGVSNFGWSIQGEAIIRTAGASGTVQNGACVGGFLNVNMASCVYENNFSLDTTAAQSVFVTADWSASSASNTVTMETLSVEILQAGVTN